MLVLMDIEWYTSEDKQFYVTQISAVRVSDDWSADSDFDAVIALPDPALYDSEHVAFAGRRQEEFIQGESIEEAIHRLSKWLNSFDVLCLWHGASKSILQSTWKSILNSSVPCPVACVRNPVSELLANLDVHIGNPYTFSAALNIETPQPPHRSINDVEAMRLLFSRIHVSQTAFTNMAKMTLPDKTIREKNLEIIQKSHWNYFFAHDSDVFHARDCRAVLAVKKIEGTVYYKTAIEKRRPCKLCNPKPKVALSSELHEAKYKELYKKPNRDQVETVRLLTGEYRTLKRGKIVGFCQNSLHPGKMTKDIMKQHDCLGKECWYFQKYQDAFYWESIEIQKQKKQNRKEQRRQERREKLLQEETLYRVKELFQQCADDTDSELDIIQVEKTAPGAYTIFYVSDNTYADWREFPALLGRIRMKHPCRNLRLRHIRDVDGHFVTRREFYEKVR